MQGGSARRRFRRDADRMKQTDSAERRRGSAQGLQLILVSRMRQALDHRNQLPAPMAHDHAHRHEQRVWGANRIGKSLEVEHDPPAAMAVEMEPRGWGARGDGTAKVENIPVAIGASPDNR